MTRVCDLLESLKAITSSGDYTTAGALNAEQMNYLIDLTLSKTKLMGSKSEGNGPLVRVHKVFAQKGETHALKFSSHVLEKVTESDADGGTEVKPTFSKVDYTLSMLMAKFDLTKRAILDSVATDTYIDLGEEPNGRFWDDLTESWLTQLGTDLETVAIQGDTTSADKLLKTFDGWDKLTDTGTNKLDAAGAGISYQLFVDALKLMPYQYRANKSRLKWLVSSSVYYDWIHKFSTRATSGGDAAYEGIAPKPLGIEMIEVPLIPEDKDVTEGSEQKSDGTFIWLVDPQNFNFFIRRNMDRSVEWKPRKYSGTYEVTLTTEAAVNVEVLQAVVKVYNISLSGTAYTG